MLKGDKVVLRALEKEDVPNCHGWINDWELKRYLDGVYPFSMMAEERWYESLLERRNAPFFAITAEDGKHIGNIDLSGVSRENSTAELGILIGEADYWGKGYGPDAIKTLLKFAFQDMNLHRVWLRVFEFNTRAIRCYEKCGFEKEGRLWEGIFREGRYWDVILMGILRNEFDPEIGAH